MREDANTENDEDDPPKESPIPPDAPVETPQADPRAPGAPDPEARPASVPEEPETTEKQIQEAFE